MAFALVANTSEATPDQGTFTSPSIDTTGADLLVISVSNYTGFTTELVVSDSKGNTWIPLTPRLKTADNARNWIYYAKNPTVGSGHTFTVGHAVHNTYGSMCVSAWSGADLTDPFDQENGAFSNSFLTSLQAGSVTPSEDNELVIAAIAIGYLGGDGFTGTASIDSGFAITNQEPNVSFNNVQSAQAYLVQTTAAVVNPTWSWSPSKRPAATAATFKAAAVAGGLPKLIGGQLINSPLVSGRLVV